ncbi:hypothetical protein [Nocardia miyunensis]|uniref:hypothetical protein n=1 Tax=Nocardia miyunensis TaxID=282684 RepID=UPI00082D9828|nr:hypothetical protein [Nocardia miyunensis]
MVRAGVVPGQRALIYGTLGVLATALVCGGIVAAFGLNRVFTGLFAGIAVGIAVLVALFGRDVVVLSDRTISRRTPLRESDIAWDRVVAGRFTLDERARWALALDLSGGDERHGELVLLSIPPVVRPISNAYEHRKREQVAQIRKMLRHKNVPVTVLPEIANALHEHWKLAPPTTR